MYFKRYFLASILFCGLLHAESSVGIGINNETLELQGSIDLNSFVGYSDITSYNLDFSYLDVNMEHLTSLGVSGESSLQGADGVKLALGAKLVFAQNFMALPLFGKLSFNLPINHALPLITMATSLAYAPPVLTFRDGLSYSEFRVEGDMEVIPNIHLFTGYRSIDTNYIEYNNIFNEALYGGMKLIF